MRSSRSRLRPSPSLTFDAIGTRWQVDTTETLTTDAASAVHALTASFDATWSRFRPDSLVSRIARSPGTYRLPPEAPELLDLYREMYECTDGAMSPLIGRALEQWGYDAAYSLRQTEAVSRVPRWEDALSFDGESVTTVSPVLIDVGAAGKGYLVDLVGRLLATHGIVEFTIDASGDILHLGRRPQRVALEHPLDTTKAIGVARLSTGALCASASNRRAWPGAHHIIDALTGRPTERVIATWVTARTCLVADGIATALFVGEPERLAERFDFEFLALTARGRIEISAGFEAEMFT